MSTFRTISNEPVPALGYGALALGGAFYGQAATDEERFKVLDRLYELGCRHWDTAHAYGDSEEIIGKWFKRTGKRDEIFLATKGGIEVKTWQARGDAAFIHEQVQTSLTRLQTDRIDLYYIHRIDGNTPIEVTIGAILELVKSNKIRHIGLSEASVSTIRRAHAVHPVSALQFEYSPFETTIERSGGILDVARELGISVVAYSPTGRGLLTGRYKSPADFDADDFRRTVPRFSEKNFPHILNLVSGLERLAKTHTPPATPAQITLAWLLAQSRFKGIDVLTIPGSKQIKYIEENWGANKVTLSDKEVEEINKMADEVEKGLADVPRYLAKNLSLLAGDTPALDSVSN